MVVRKIDNNSTGNNDHQNTNNITPSICTYYTADNKNAVVLTETNSVFKTNSTSENVVETDTLKKVSKRKQWEMENEEFMLLEKEQKAQKLKYILEKAGIYSNWLSEKLKTTQKELEESSKLINSSKNTKKDLSTNDASTAETDNVFEDSKKNSIKRKKRAGNSIKNKNFTKLIDGQEEFDLILKEHLHNRDGRNPRQPCLVTGCNMRDYQFVGVEWLVSLYDHGLNGILAVLYHGNQEERSIIRSKKLKKKDSFFFPAVVTSYEIAMNDRKFFESYQWKYIIVDEGHRLKNLNCKLIKELKSYSSANRLLLTGTPLHNNLKELWSLLNFLMPDIFDDLEIFSEWFDFSEDIKENENNDFICSASKTSIIGDLHNILKPFILRRVKDEVEISIPAKKEIILYCPLMPTQKKLYEAALLGVAEFSNFLNQRHNDELEEIEEKVPEDAKIISKIGSKKRKLLNRNTQEINYNLDEVSDEKYFDYVEKRNELVHGDVLKEKKDDNKINKVKNLKLQNIMVQLRKICNHPLLFDEQIEDNLENIYDIKIQDFNNKECSEIVDGSIFDLTSNSTLISKYAPIVKESGKFLMLERIIPTLISKGHNKILIFSQMTKILDILQDWFEMVKKIKICRIDGGVNLAERSEQINNFNNKEDYMIFLLSTRAGGLGINLTVSDTVIIYDSDWNPQIDLQAQDRVHRIGQTRPVTIFRLITRDTVESKILEKAKEKRTLEKLVIHKEQFKGSLNYYQNNKKISSVELKSILQKDQQEYLDEERNKKKELTTFQHILDEKDLNFLLDRTWYDKKDIEIDCKSLDFKLIE
ncbi:hypothetical protein HK099_002172 [Clydaea vesicula]|uniref:Lymphoid-specific helicase n=1 Tax=Clydaea vesicula TaxID=447962 RepID=A0AAD5U7G2_9FUNG|nr:hypothetical protein HK099_002172 [Clydaea vesicula]